MRVRRIAAAALAAGALVAGCRVELGAPAGGAAGSGPQTVRVYSSMYKQVIDAVEPVLAARLAKTAPGVTVEWFQSGSEKVATRLDAEFASGGSPCDLLLTSDPNYYARLKADGRLVPYVSPAALRQPKGFVEPDGYWATARVSTMVIGVSAALEGSAKAPASFHDLAKPGLRVAMGDPLSSGTNFTTVSVLRARYGWDFLAALKKNGAVVAGGNSNVQQRLLTGETDAGWVLLENLLAARAKGDKLGVVIPADGAVIVPGPIALLEHGRHSEAARAVYDALLSDDVQKVVVEKGLMHSPDPALPPPAGAPALDALLAKATAPSTETADAIKTHFNSIYFP
ncbi:MAG TPA: extracellular solute-binding protein [bacterium]|nr:extracellular solute-binding protein [bacterium]